MIHACSYSIIVDDIEDEVGEFIYEEINEHEIFPSFQEAFFLLLYQ